MYSRSFMFLGVILFIILSTQVLAANHAPEPSINEPMASMKNRLMFSKSDPMTVSESLIEKKSERLRIYRDELYEELKKKSLEYKERLWQDILRDMYGKDGKK
ncbi:hypothetical protein P8452_20022 [Trifolium repens]|nr:hypothetical protein P8452_20013 [Trifolium repens]WJX31606.1 hypothetical protein P8452_20017 [Trifolium repens]WJX31611.1 hypothetical protein P8452_20022 [Trifolium repens]